MTGQPSTHRPNHDREFAIAGDEFPCAVNRIDKPDPVRQSTPPGIVVLRFFRNDEVVREAALEFCYQKCVDGAIHVRYRFSIRFVADRAAGLEVGEDALPGFCDQLAGKAGFGIKHDNGQRCFRSGMVSR
jgi:hypothetical protein